MTGPAPHARWLVYERHECSGCFADVDLKPGDRCDHCEHVAGGPEEVFPDLFGRLSLVATEARKFSEKFMRDIDTVNRMIDYKPGELPMKRDQGLEALNAALEALNL